MSIQVQMSYKTETAEAGEGVLYIVATPIGNLEDMTYRAVRILREANVIAAEDTRQTRKLLTHFEIEARVLSYHEHNKEASGPELVRLMKEEGQTIALVSDAGMPAISDPGEDLVRLALEEGIRVIPIPGANAALTALVASGLPTAGFRFIGFPPRTRKGLRELCDKLKRETDTLLFYESPHRVAKTLAGMLEAWGNRRVVLARELTKRYEEFARGTLEEAIALLEETKPLGEYCLLVEGAASRTSSNRMNAQQDSEGSGTESAASGIDEMEDDPEGWWRGLTVEEHVGRYEQLGEDRKAAMKRAAQDRGVSKRDIYQELLRITEN